MPRNKYMIDIVNEFVLSLFVLTPLTGGKVENGWLRLES